jgi:hypothetical protein
MCQSQHHNHVDAIAALYFDSATLFYCFLIVQSIASQVYKCHRISIKQVDEWSINTSCLVSSRPRNESTITAVLALYINTLILAYDRTYDTV